MARKPVPPDATAYAFEYTPEMRERAVRCIAERLANAPLELIEAEYYEVCFEQFRRRIARAGGTKSLMRNKLEAEGHTMPKLFRPLFADYDAEQMNTNVELSSTSPELPQISSVP